MDEEEWRRTFFQNEWCPGPVIVEGHKIPCSLERKHEGECVATLKSVREHKRGGKKECVRSNCGGGD